MSSNPAPGAVPDSTPGDAPETTLEDMQEVEAPARPHRVDTAPRAPTARRPLEDTLTLPRPGHDSGDDIRPTVPTEVRTLEDTQEVDLPQGRGLEDTRSIEPRPASSVEDAQPAATESGPAPNEAEPGATRPRSFPPPPMAQLTGSARIGGEHVVVRLPGGDKITGILTDFSGENGTVTVVPGGGAEPRTLALDETKMVQIAAKERWSPVEPEHEQELATSVREFEVTFADGDTLHGRTVGSRHDRHGLYLFPMDGADHYYCTFVPHGALASHTIGSRIGELLVEDGMVAEQAIAAALAAQEMERNLLLGETLVSQAIVTTQELENALRTQQANLREVRIGELLVDEGLITEAQLAQVLTRQEEKRGKPIGEMLIEMGVLPRSSLHQTLAKKLGVPAVDVTRFFVDPAVVERVPAEIITRFNVLPLYVFGGRLVVATENPLDWEPIEAISFATGMHVDPVIAPREEIANAVAMALDESTGTARKMEIDLSAYRGTSDEEVLGESQYADNIVVNVVNQIIRTAFQMGASDIHIEPNTESDLRVRVRKDGELRTLLEVPAKLRQALVARIKVMAGLNIAAHRNPQDGRINLRQFLKLEAELRVATIPTTGGNEDVVMRIANRGGPVPIDDLALSADNRKRLLEAAARPYGLFLVTGPTGSGKSTTVYSILEQLNSEERKIWTAEDPVELSIPGIRQVQVNETVGLDFANALRAFLRADPDVIVVGEIRDEETASAAIEASLTGHLVLATLHTNTAVETVARLLDIGMNPFNFADALIGVLAQRLARQLCEACKEAYTPGGEELTALAQEYCYERAGSTMDSATTVARWRAEFAVDGELRLYRAHGCNVCEGDGYAGRVALHELLDVDDRIERMIQSHTPSSTLREAALDAGMRTLRQDGIEKVLQGYTDVQQVRRVCVR